MMSRKQSKIDNYWLSKPVPISNNFNGLDINNNERIEKIIKSLLLDLPTCSLSSTTGNRYWRL